MRALTDRVARVLLGRLKVWGPSRAARAVWDREFSAGRWRYIDETDHDPVYRYIATYCRQGSILDLGCGAGNTGNELPLGVYREYVGVDLSAVAVAIAQRRTQENGRSHLNRYQQGDIATYRPLAAFDVILFRESIWYLRPGRLKGVLDRYKAYLSPAGVFIVRMHDRERLRRIVMAIRRHYSVVDEYHPNDGADIILVFR